MNAARDAQETQAAGARGAEADPGTAVMGQIKSGMMHDFNNMLGIIKGNAALALSELKSGDPGYDELSEITLAATRAQSLAKHILTLSRGLELARTRVCVNDMVLDTFNMMKRITPRTILFKLALADNPLHVSADKCLIEQVIVNLCKNAIHAMPGGGTLLVKTYEIHGRAAAGPEGAAPRPRYAVIKVFDTGCGIPADCMDRIFEPFFSTGPREQRAGLGLFISKYIVQNHGGVIHVNSIPGSGTIFSVYLPLA